MRKLMVPISALALVASSAIAQPTAPRPLEFGIDAGVGIGIGDNSYTTIGIPVQALRVGFPVSPRVSLEPKIRINIVSDEGSFTSYRADLGLLYHFGSDRYPGAYQRAGLYARPFVGITGFNADPDGPGDGSSDSAGLIGAGIGYKFPIISRLSSRFEANLAHVFGEGDATEIGLLAGLSFFTR